MLRHCTTSGTMTSPSTAHHVIEATHSLHPVGRVLERTQGLGVAPPDFPWPPHARHGLLIDVLLQQTGWDWAGCTRCPKGASSGLHAARPSQGCNPQCPGMPHLGCAAATHTGCTQPSSSWAQRQPPPCKCSWGSSQGRRWQAAISAAPCRPRRGCCCRITANCTGPIQIIFAHSLITAACSVHYQATNMPHRHAHDSWRHTTAARHHTAPALQVNVSQAADILLRSCTPGQLTR